MNLVSISPRLQHTLAFQRCERFDERLVRSTGVITPPPMTNRCSTPRFYWRDSIAPESEVVALILLCNANALTRNPLGRGCKIHFNSVG